ncbi:MAG TPA: dNTP triphosphohydrolase [Cerasibacillus sp.]|uniref:deoxyguanosinetriphosphate triphosphohydrolase family protein n=1 Tax=Cerasibacillus sp. TaxID=2498711 RepID=UPI002F40F077
MGKVLNEFLREYYYPLKEYYCPSNNNKVRIHEENTERARNHYQRDYSRVLYSSSFRRLQGKMQLLGVKNDSFYRNRLTHSLEVAQITRGICEYIRDRTNNDEIYDNDIYVVEAGALAHDLGNPPFGHHGERVLNELLDSHGGFEGNAQTLRVINRLEKKLPDARGLNLTKRTILSVVKYFKKNNRITKKFIYDEDYEFIENFLESDIKPRTIDVQIIDLADEIAYAAHDLEDALSLKLFSIDEYLFEFRNKSENSFYILKNLVKKANDKARNAQIYNSSEEFGFIFRKELISNLVHLLINDIDVIRVDEKHIEITGTLNEYELGFKNYNKFVKDLKSYTFECINRTNVVQLYEKQGEKVIKGLFDALNDNMFNKDNKLLPVEFRNNNECKQRVIGDYISGMMDSFAINLYRKFYGDQAISKLYDNDYFKDYR